MQLTKLTDHHPNELVNINYQMGNTCNYACWYCFPGSNEGTYRWPNFELAKNNLEHIINCYKKAGKTRFNIDLIGGEPTLWPELGKFTKYFRELGCTFHLSTNGSRSIKWWEKNGGEFDTIYISCHHERIDVEHIKELADMLWSKHNNVICDVLMDTKAWDKCVTIVDSLLESKTSFPVNVKPIKLGKCTQDTSYDQSQYLLDQRKRNPKQEEIFKPKRKKPPVQLTYEDGSTKNVSKNFVLINNLNNFKGWTCNLGVDTIFINFDGSIGSVCGNSLLGFKSGDYNLYDAELPSKFNPVINPVTCAQKKCMCQVGFLLEKYDPTYHTP